MNLLIARFVMLMLMAVGIAVAALGQRGDAPGRTDLGDVIEACTSGELLAGQSTGREEPGHRTPRRAIRWQSFLPGTFR